MKKLILSLTALATMAFAFTSCEDVPEPYAQPSVNPDTTVVVQPAGTGTAADPYNVAMALQLLQNGTNTAEKVYTKGILTSVDIDTSYGNATYYISDIANNAETTLEVYRGYYYNGDKFTSDDQLAVGDTVVVYGVLTNYSGTYEVTQGSQIYSINGKTNGTTPDTPTTQPSGTGTEADPYNVAAALNVISALSWTDLNTHESTGEIYVKGKVSSINEISTSFGNATYYISDDGTTGTQLYIFRSKYLNNEKFTSEDQLKVGDEVVIVGTFVNYYGNTPESSANSSHLVSIKSNGSTDTPDTPTGEALTISGTTVTLTNTSATAGTETATIDFSAQGLENAAEVTTFTLSDGTTITFDGNGQRNAPKYYSGTKGIRVYLDNIIRFAGVKKIAKIEMSCDSYNGTDYVGNKGASITFDGNNAVYTNSDASVTSGGGVQLRVKTITITYAQ